MSIRDIIRAWKDEEFRQSLTAEQRALLPDHPAGAIALDDALLQNVAGGLPRRTIIVLSKTCQVINCDYVC